LLHDYLLYNTNHSYDFTTNINLLSSVREDPSQHIPAHQSDPHRRTSFVLWLSSKLPKKLGRSPILAARCWQATSTSLEPPPVPSRILMCQPEKPHPSSDRSNPDAGWTNSFIYSNQPSCTRCGYRNQCNGLARSCSIQRFCMYPGSLSKHPAIKPMLRGLLRTYLKWGESKWVSLIWHAQLFLKSIVEPNLHP